MKLHRKVYSFLLLAYILVAKSECLKFEEGNQQQVNGFSEPPKNQQDNTEERRNGKHLLDFVGLGTNQNVDPYLRRTNEQCLNGELSECFKSQALNTFGDFFNRDAYVLTPHVRVVRLPETQLRSLNYEPYEFIYEGRQISESSEWNDMIQFLLRKAERFMKSNAFEVQIPEDITEGGRYSPRFIDEITDELDIIEDKSAPLFNKHRIKKMFIPMLIILKLFKLKLLLFLPFLLGLTGLKKILGLAAFIIPGIIGYFKLCKPTSGFGNHIYSGGNVPQYSSHGVGGASYNPLYSKYSNSFSQPEPSFASPYDNYYRDTSVISTSAQGGVRFGDDAQSLAYSEYRNSNEQPTK